MNFADRLRLLNKTADSLATIGTIAEPLVKEIREANESSNPNLDALEAKVTALFQQINRQ